MMLASTIVPRPHPVAPLCQVRVDLLEQTTPQPVPLQQVPKVQNRRLVRQRTRQTQPREPPHRLDLVQHVLHPRVAQVVEQLHAVNPQHRRQRVRLPPPARLRIQRPNPRLQTLPRNQRLHPLQKQLPPRPPLLPLVLHIRERHLLHRPPPRSSRSALELPPRKSNVPGIDLFRVFLGESEKCASGSSVRGFLSGQSPSRSSASIAAIRHTRQSLRGGVAVRPLPKRDESH